MLSSSGIWFLLLMYCTAADAAVTNHEYLLREILMTNHSRDVFPVKSNNDNLEIYLDMKLISVEGVNDRTQEISLMMQLTRRWNNALLSWDKNQHGGVEYITLSASELWLPDIQTQDEDFTCASDCQSKEKIVIHESGECDWIVTQFRVKHHCGMDLRYFPFDTQICDIHFHPRDDYSGRLRIRAGELKENPNFNSNHIWTIMSHAWENKSEVSESKTSYQVMLKIEIKRKPTHYMYTLFIPCLVVAAMSVLSVLLPVESGERMSMIMTSLLAMVVLMQLSSDSLPASSDEAPHIIDYYVSTLILIMVSMVMSSFVINFYHSGETGSKPPRWLKNFTVRYLVKFTCATPPVKQKKSCIIGAYPVDVIQAMDDKIELPDYNSENNHIKNNHKNNHRNNHADNNRIPSVSRNSVKASAAWVQDDEEEEEEWEIDEWKFVALVIDRIQLMIIGLVFLLYSVIFLTLMATHEV